MFATLQSGPLAPTRKWRGLVFVFLVCAQLLPLSNAAEEMIAAPKVGTPLSDRPELIVGVANDNFPFGYVGTSGVWTGFSGDILDGVARVMNLRTRRVILPGENLRQHFREGDYDLLQSLTETPERQKFADFSVPYLILKGAIFVRKGSGIHDLDSLQNRRFAATGKDTIGARFLRDHNISVVETMVNSVEQGLLMIEDGKCDGLYASNLTALSIISKHDLKNIEMLNVQVGEYDIRHCFAVHKGDAQLLARLNEGLAILHTSGEFDRIYDKWFGHLTSPVVSRKDVINYSIVALIAALSLALLALQRQRKLRAKIERQTREMAGQKALLQTLYDNIPMGICVIDHDESGYRVLMINRQAEPYFGLSASQASGALLADFAPGSEWVSLLSELLSDGIKSRRVLREERRLLSANKRLLFTLVPMTAAIPGSGRVLVLTEDVTERRNLDDELAQSRKLRAVGELVGGIAHEFNNLITPIILQTGQIRMDWGHDEALMAEIRVISEAVQRSSELTRRLLTFGRKSDQGAELVHVSSVVGNCFALLKLTMDRRIQWEQAVPPDLPPIYLCVTDLNQIILNLVINARDTLMEKLALQKEGWTPVIRIEASLLPADFSGRIDHKNSSHRILGWQRLTVHDNGMGMPPEIQERIFEPFFTTKEVGKGTGLGLATVWHLVTAVSGRIEVESTPGSGTTFHVYLPMLPAPEPSKPAARKMSFEHKPAEIFVAEDDPLVASAVSNALRRAGHSVRHVADGSDAWQHLQAHAKDYDLLLLDINMPGMDGIELSQRVRSAARFTGQIIIASGRLSSEDLQQLAMANVNKVLSKPFTIDELLDSIRSCLLAGSQQPAGKTP